MYARKWNWQNIVPKYRLSETIHIHQNGAQVVIFTIYYRACPIVQCFQVPVGDGDIVGDDDGDDDGDDGDDGDGGKWRSHLW